MSASPRLLRRKLTASAMSAAGQERPNYDVRSMSALHPIATKLLRRTKRRYGPKATFLHCGKQSPNSLLLHSNYSNV
jgi:hypothetical protein